MKQKVISSVLLLLVTGAVAAGPNNIKNTNLCFSDSMHIERVIKRNLVDLYPNPSSNGNIRVSANAVKEELHFYVFDLEGTLLHQIVLKGKEKHLINNLKKGVYTYDVFKNDESVEQGKIVVK